MTYIDIFNALLARAKESARGSLDNHDISAINAFSSGWLASYIAGRAETDGELLADMIERGMINNKADDNTKKAKKLIRDVARANINSSNGKGVYK
jgi:hypothetical protein